MRPPVPFVVLADTATMLASWTPNAPSYQISDIWPHVLEVFESVKNTGHFSTR